MVPIIVAIEVQKIKKKKTSVSSFQKNNNEIPIILLYIRVEQ